MSIRITRRDFFGILGSFLLANPSFSAQIEAVDQQVEFFASAYMDQNKRYGIAIFDHRGKIYCQHSLPERGHAIAVSRASSLLVAFARRPENFALVVDLNQKERPYLFKTPEHSHFYGHGVFSHDGRLLYATQNRFEDGQGSIGVYDASNHFVFLSEFDSYGIGPHELVFMPNEHTLCVANGGILTHPDTGRTKLNLHQMQSNVAFIDSKSGDLIAKFEVPKHIHRLSLRHIAMDHWKRAWLGGQYQDAIAQQTPLIATADLNQGLCFLESNPIHTHTMAHYISSVAADDQGRKIAFTSSKAGRVLIVDAKTRSLASLKKQTQVSGVSHDGERFISSTLAGEFNHKKSSLYWDNHMIAL